MQGSLLYSASISSVHCVQHIYSADFVMHASFQLFICTVRSHRTIPLSFLVDENHTFRRMSSTLTVVLLTIAGNEYNSAPAHHHQPPPGGQPDITSPASAAPRYSQSFYPTYPTQASVGSASMPSVHDAMDPMHPHATTLSTSAMKDEGDSRKRTLFGDVPESKRRKFILVEDGQRGTRVRVRVMLDQVKMDDMPDAHLKINAVYPRSYYPRQIGSPSGSPRARAGWDDEDDEMEGVSGTMPTRGKTLVPVNTMDGAEAKLPVPRMTKSRRNKETALNELGYRMSWGQARTFNGRTLFLQRSRKYNIFSSTREIVLMRCSRRIQEQDAEHNGCCRPGRLLHRSSLRDASWEAKVVGQEQADEARAHRTH